MTLPCCCCAKPIREDAVQASVNTSAIHMPCVLGFEDSFPDMLMSLSYRLCQTLWRAKPSTSHLIDTSRLYNLAIAKLTGGSRGGQQGNGRQESARYGRRHWQWPRGGS